MGLIRIAFLVALLTGVSLGGQAVPRPPAAPYPTPQGTATENGLAGFAKILCSGVFVSERAPEDVAQGSAYFFMPAAERDQVTYVVDRQAKVARASLGSITTRPEYGGFFWLNGVGNWNLPAETYLAAGAGGQNTWIVPSRDVVIVRMGHMRGERAARAVTNRALGLVMEATAGSPAAQLQDTLRITLGDSDQLVEVDQFERMSRPKRIAVAPKVR